MKVRSLIALVVIVHAALFLGAAGPGKAPKGKKAAPAPTASTLVSPGFHRGG